MITNLNIENQLAINQVNSFLEKQGSDSLQILTYTQSIEFASLQKKQGLEVFLCGQTNSTGDKLVSMCLYSIVNAKRGRAMQVIHGPICNPESDEVREYLDFLKVAAKKAKCDYLRINPIFSPSAELTKVFKKAGFHDMVYENMPLTTSILDLSAGFEKIQLGYSKSLKSNIKKARRLEESGDLIIKIEKTLDPKCKEIYAKFLGSKDYEANSFKHIKEETDFLSSDLNDVSVVGTAYYKGNIVAFSTLIKRCKGGKYVANHYSASISNKELLDNNNFTSYIHHKLISYCIDQGINSYDFWGVAPKNSKNHPWQGFSIFKKGFGGEDKSIMRGQDYPITPRYWITNLYERYQKIKRGH